MKKLSSKVLFASFVSLSLMGGCISMKVISPLIGQAVFNRVGLRPFKGNVISFTNYYHRGVFIPAGTECTVKDISKKAITFTVNRKEYILVDWLIDSSEEKIKESFYKFFTKNRDEVGLNKIKTKFYDSVISGFEEIGMTKEEVLLCLGYPAYLGRKDPTNDDGREFILSLNEWYYLKNRFNKLLFIFKTGKLYKIIN